MNRILIFFLLLATSTYCSYGQKRDYIWIFDQGTGINFNNISNPFPINTNLNGIGVENYASISSDSGNLLFHVNGNDSIYSTSNTYQIFFSDVYDRNHHLMPDGDSLLSDLSCTQGSLIIPFPGDSVHYYIFNLNTPPQLFTGFPSGLYYSVVDMTANNGLGNVVSKNNAIYQDTITEKLTACKHGNGQDWWLLLHDWNNNRFVEFIVSPSGITGPIYQTIGTSYITGGTTGPIVFSKDGSRCVSVGGPNIINVFDFDRCTGLLSNPTILNTGNGFITGSFLYGCSLSPDGNLLYVSNYDTLFQYNLLAANIAASKLVVYIKQNPDAHIIQHMLGPDNKIYVAMVTGGFSIPPDTAFNNINMNLSVINSPDSIGAGCNFTPLSFYLNGKRCRGGFPNMVNYNLEGLSSCPLSINEFSDENRINVTISPNPANDLILISSDYFERGKLRILDLTGRILIQESFNKKKDLDISTLNSGIYIIQLEEPNKRMLVGKFLKE
ncbi:MAG: T9SS type A sorting domain-containing protein [Bacteroidota bacterium]